MENDLFQKWQSQLRKGYLELCVLIVLRQKHTTYGFELLRLLNEAGISLNEGTLYPLLNRMHKNGWLDSYWIHPEGSGHPRRFYQLSDTGVEQLPKMLDAFQQNECAVSNLMELI